MSWGSSPLTRGKPVIPDDVRDRAGLIPAHAGKTCARSPGSLGEEAHPRSRGENVIAAIAALVAIGSSPLTRGKRMEVEGKGHCLGLIPAHAGKTTPLMTDLQTRRGSSPLTRGKPQLGM